MSSWLVPTLMYALLAGSAGVTTKLALRTISWQQLLLFVPVMYAIPAIVVAAKGTSLPLGTGGAWALVTALVTAGSLVFFFFALHLGDASTVVPVGSIYPLVTVLGSALFLSERVTPTRGIGTALIIAGVILLAR